MKPFCESGQWMALALSSDGIIDALSSTAEQLTGYSASELVGRPVTTILAEHSAFEAPQMLKLARDWGVWQGDILHRERSGKSIKARASLAQLNARNHDAAGFLLLSILQMPCREETVDPSLGEVAVCLREIVHEMNNPLAVMMGFTQLLLLDAHCDGKTRSDVERLYVEMKRIVEVVEKLHTYALALQQSEPVPTARR